jgi:competence protein ComEC
MSRIALTWAVCWLSGLAMSLGGFRWDSGSALICCGGLILMGQLLHFKRKQLILTGIVLFSVAAVYGTWIKAHHHSQLPESDSEFVVSGTIIEPVAIDGDRVRFILQSTQEGEKIAVSIRLASQDELSEALSWRRGDQVTIKGELTLPPTARNFGQFDYRQYLSYQHIHRMLLVKGLDQAEVTTDHSWSRASVLAWVDHIRAHSGETISKLYPIDQSGFMSSLLIGLRDRMDEETFGLFSRLGLTHIIAISGLHVAIVIGGWMGLLRFMRVTRETNITSAMILIPIYIIFSGASPSVVRAGIMALIALYAARRRWLKDGLNIVAVTAILMTMWNPFYIYDVSFQLSFAVTAGLIVGVPVVVRWINLGPPWLNGTLAVTLVAQAVSFPLTIYYFNQFSLLSGLANLLLVPVFSLIVLPLGYISVILYYIWSPLGSCLASIVSMCNLGSFWFMDRLEALPGLRFIWASPPAAWIAVYIGLLLTVFWCSRVMKEVDSILFPVPARLAKRLMVVSMCLGIIWLSTGYGFLGRSGIATVSFLDVGQGDSILIRTPSNRVILVDGGGTLNFMKAGEEWRLRKDPYEVGKDLLVPLLKKRGIGQIDYLIMTHADMDHIGGLQAVLEEIPVKRVLFNGTLRTNPHTKKIFTTALEQHIPIYPVWDGRELVVDEHTKLDFLYPVVKVGEAGTIPLQDDQNGYSVVFTMDMYDSTFLFTGDMDAAAEREVLARVVERNAGGSRIEPIDVLKVAHHGSKTSTSESWLGLWQPKAAVISVGERNMYRHPSPLVIDRLSRHQVFILRTDLHGEVQIKVSKGGLEWRYYKGAQMTK